MSERRYDPKTKQAPFREKRRRNLKRKIIILVASVLVLFIGFVVLTHLNRFQIENLKVSGNEITPTYDLEKIVRTELSGNYLFIFPHNSTFIYPKQQIERSLLAQTSTLTLANISRDGFKSLNVAVTERQGDTVWCQGTAEEFRSTPTQYNCYFADDQGYLFALAPYVSGNVFFRFFGGDATSANAIGTSVTDAPRFIKIQELKEALIKLDFKLSGVSVGNDNEDIFLLQPTDWQQTAPQIMVRDDKKINSMMHDLESAIMTEPLRGDLVTKYSKLLYIDARFENKVFYKFDK